MPKKPDPLAGTIYKRRSKLVAALDLLTEAGVVGQDNSARYLKTIEGMFLDWRNLRRGAVKESAHVSDYSVSFSRCKRRGCPNEPAKDQAYCSRECSPCGHLRGGSREE